MSRALRNDCFDHGGGRMRHDQVLALLADRLDAVTGMETVPVIGAAGRIAAREIVSPLAVPQSDNAAVDGYAFAHGSHAARDGRLRVAARIAAGDVPQPLAPGTCARIFTGAPMPAGADTVAMQEDCAPDPRDPAVLVIPEGLKTGANRRRAGEDFKAGDPVIRAGQRLRPQDLAALAATGHAEIAVRTRLRIAIVSTGDEIVPAGQAMTPAQVHDANRPMLLALAADPATLVTDLGHRPDDPDTLRDTLADAARTHDLIITSGGASRGAEDHLSGVVDQLGQLHLWQVAIKPGRPILFGQIGNAVLMGLPGNPVAVLVCFAIYGRPVIGHLCGARVIAPAGFELPAAFAMPVKKTGRREFLRGWVAPHPESGRMQAHKFARDGSGLISGLQAAGGLIELHEDVAAVHIGDPVRFIPFSELGLVS